MSEPGQLIADRYRLVRLLGTGGMGVVWEAWDERLERRVAIKQLRLPPDLPEHEAELASQRAMREARITARLHHRNAISVFDVVDENGRPCLIMEFVPSVTLAAILKEGPLQHQEAARLGAEVASALAAAHELGIVHRDVKPSNILVADDGHALISDFGISQALGDPTLTATGLVHGTPAYLSPEVARGASASFASDSFGLGATLYTALEGRPPFGTDTNSIALLHRVASGNFEPPTRSGPLTPLLLQLLSADPGDRPSMADAAHTLEEIAAGRTPAQPSAAGDADAPTTVMPPPPPEEPTTVAEPETPRHPAAAPIAAAASFDDLLRDDASGPRSAPPNSGGSSPAQAGPRRRRIAWIGALVAVLAAIAVAAAFVLPKLGGPDRGTAAGPEPATSSAASQPASPSARPSPSAAPTSAQSSAQSSPKESSSPTSRTSPTSTHSSKGHGSPKKQLKDAITGYYAVMPGDLDTGWSHLTKAYQVNPTGGRSGYERFWAAIDRVDAHNVTAIPPDRAEATLVYHYKDGRVVEERTAFRLAEEDGELKIDGSQVLSSSTR